MQHLQNVIEYNDLHMTVSEILKKAYFAAVIKKNEQKFFKEWKNLYI